MRRTVDILAHGVLIIAIAALVGAGLARLRLVGGVVGVVGRAVGLRESSGSHGEDDEGGGGEHRELKERQDRNAQREREEGRGGREGAPRLVRPD